MYGGINIWFVRQIFVVMHQIRHCVEKEYFTPKTVNLYHLHDKITFCCKRSWSAFLQRTPMAEKLGMRIRPPAVHAATPHSLCPMAHGGHARATIRKHSQKPFIRGAASLIGDLPSKKFPVRPVFVPLSMQTAFWECTWKGEKSYLGKVSRHTAQTYRTYTEGGPIRALYGLWVWLDVLRKPAQTYCIRVTSYSQNDRLLIPCY